MYPTNKRSTLREPLLQQDLVGQSSYEVDRALIDENNREIHHINAEVGALREVYQDMRGLVHEQGEALNQVEQNTYVANVRVEKGVDELKIANKYACSARWKMIILAIICLLFLIGIIIAVIVLAVVFSR